MKSGIRPAQAGLPPVFGPVDLTPVFGLGVAGVVAGQ